MSSTQIAAHDDNDDELRHRRGPRRPLVALPSADARDEAAPRRLRVVRPMFVRAAAARTARSLRGDLAQAGMATAEYAIATLAAAGFAGVLVVVLKSGAVRSLLTGIVKQALSL
ncbi:DUF4244 domain-containing protein [Cellulomonas sp. HZM]|uniref:DUF4244 domain-containing protein n=1 Tax=Cellulomonas sp. HZM TaxID=1454010 RepID=UPI000A5D359A|nr:DUF4244 domain-containing protein [Cellulomonas sp. HZM]